MKNTVLTAVKNLIAQKELLEKQIQDIKDLVGTQTAEMVEARKNWQHGCEHIIYKWLNAFGKDLFSSPYECVLCGARFEHVENCKGNLYDVTWDNNFNIKNFERPAEVSEDPLIPENRKAEVIEKRAQIALFQSEIANLNAERRRLQILFDEIMTELHNISKITSAIFPEMFPRTVNPLISYPWD